MPTPTLILGIGSTGHEIAGKVKSIIKTRYGTEIPDFVKFVVFDTVTNPDNMFDISANEYFGLGTFSVKKALNDWKRTDLDRFWPIRNYVPNLRNFSKGAGQIRCHGRLAFWYHAQRIRANIQTSLRDLSALGGDGADGQVQINVWLTGILSNATCGGSFLDYAYLTRQICEDMGIMVNKLYGMFVDSSVVFDKQENKMFKEKAAFNGIAAMNELHFWMYENFERNEPAPYEIPQREDSFSIVDPTSSDLIGDSVQLRPLDIVFLLQNQNSHGFNLSDFDDYKEIAANGIASYTITDAPDTRLTDLMAHMFGKENYASINHLQLEFPVNDAKEYCVSKFIIDISDQFILRTNNLDTLEEFSKFESLDLFVDNFMENELVIVEKGKDQLFDRFDSIVDLNSKLAEIQFVVDNQMDEKNYSAVVTKIDNELKNNWSKEVKEKISIEAKDLLYQEKEFDQIIDEYNTLQNTQKEQINRSIKHQIELKLYENFLNNGYWKLASQFLNELLIDLRVNLDDVETGTAVQLGLVKLETDNSEEINYKRKFNNEIKHILQELEDAFDSFFRKNSKLASAKNILKQHIKNRMTYELKKIECSIIMDIYKELIAFVSTRLDSIKYLIEIYENYYQDSKKRIKDIAQRDIASLAVDKNILEFKLRVGLYNKTLNDFIYTKIVNTGQLYENINSDSAFLSKKLIPIYREIRNLYLGKSKERELLNDRLFRLSKKEKMKEEIFDTQSIIEPFENSLNKDFTIEDILIYEIEILLSDYWRALESKDDDLIKDQLKRWQKYFMNMDIDNLRKLKMANKEEAIRLALIAYFRKMTELMKPFWKINFAAPVLQRVFIYHSHNEYLPKILTAANFGGGSTVYTEKVDGVGKNMIELISVEGAVPINKLELYETQNPIYKKYFNSKSMPPHSDNRYKSIWYADIFDIDEDTDFDQLVFFPLAEGIKLIATSGDSKTNYRLMKRIGQHPENLMLGKGRERAFETFKELAGLYKGTRKEVEEAFDRMTHAKDQNGEFVGTRAIFNFLDKILGDLATEKEKNKIDTSLSRLYEKQFFAVNKFKNDKAREYGMLEYLK